MEKKEVEEMCCLYGIDAPPDLNKRDYTTEDLIRYVKGKEVKTGRISKTLYTLLEQLESELACGSAA